MTDTSRETMRKRWEPFVVPMISLGLLAGLQALHGSWIQSSYREVDLLSQVFPKAPKADTAKLAAALADTAEMSMRMDTVKAQAERVAKVLQDSNGIVSIEDPQQLSKVFASLKAGKGARIAWFGDSFIEGDILVQDVREMLQRIFGGKGVGLVPATSITAQFRQSVHHTFSRDWDEASILGRRSPTPLGITGHVFYPVASQDSSKESWVDLKAAARSGSSSFDRVRVLYGFSRDSAASVSCWGVRKPLLPGAGLHEVRFNAAGAKGVRVGFRSADSLSVYGISLEGDSAGVLIDNFSFRGNSGTGLLKIPADHLRQTDRLLDYRLVVLQYGTNVTDASMPGFGWYGKKMVEVVAHLRKGFPNADFLLIGVGDRGSRTGEGIVSNPTVSKVIEAQRHAAKETGSAFWDLREAMGGENSMGAWAKAGLASQDYTHISPGGGRRLGRAFAKAFLKAWEGDL